MMPELMALKLYHSVKEVLQTPPSIKIHIEKKYTKIDITNGDWTKSGAKGAGFYNKHVLWNKPTEKEY